MGSLDGDCALALLINRGRIADRLCLAWPLVLGSRVHTLHWTTDQEHPDMFFASSQEQVRCSFLCLESKYDYCILSFSIDRIGSQDPDENAGSQNSKSGVRTTVSTFHNQKKKCRQMGELSRTKQTHAFTPHDAWNIVVNSALLNGQETRRAVENIG